MSSTLKSSISGITRFNMFGKFFAYRLCYTENILYPKIKYEFFAKLGDRINPAPSCGVLNPAGRLFYVIQSPQQSAGYSGRCWINMRLFAKGRGEFYSRLRLYKRHTGLKVLSKVSISLHSSS